MLSRTASRKIKRLAVRWFDFCRLIIIFVRRNFRNNFVKKISVIIDLNIICDMPRCASFTQWLCDLSHQNSWRIELLHGLAPLDCRGVPMQSYNGSNLSSRNSVCYVTLTGTISNKYLLLVTCKPETHQPGQGIIVDVSDEGYFTMWAMSSCLDLNKLAYFSF